MWHERAWAEWLALVSGMVYLPVEIYKLGEKFNWLRVSVLTVNLVVVALVALVLWRTIETRRLKRSA